MDDNHDRMMFRTIREWLTIHNPANDGMVLFSIIATNYSENQMLKEFIDDGAMVFDLSPSNCKAFEYREEGISFVIPLKGIDTLFSINYNEIEGYFINDCLVPFSVTSDNLLAPEPENIEEALTEILTTKNDKDGLYRLQPSQLLFDENVIDLEKYKKKDKDIGCGLTDSISSDIESKTKEPYLKLVWPIKPNYPTPDERFAKYNTKQGDVVKDTTPVEIKPIFNGTPASIEFRSRPKNKRPLPDGWSVVVNDK